MWWTNLYERKCEFGAGVGKDFGKVHNVLGEVIPTLFFFLSEWTFFKRLLLQRKMKGTGNGEEVKPNSKGLNSGNVSGKSTAVILRTINLHGDFKPGNGRPCYQCLCLISAAVC